MSHLRKAEDLCFIEQRTLPVGESRQHKLLVDFRLVEA